MIDRTDPGIYELKDIYANEWTSVRSPTKFGKSFKATVQASLLTNIRINSLKTNNHWTYTVGL